MFVKLHTLSIIHTSKTNEHLKPLSEDYYQVWWGRIAFKPNYAPFRLIILGQEDLSIKLCSLSFFPQIMKSGIL